MEMKNLFAAMAKAFGAFEGATKDSVNPHFKSKYADLSSVMDAVKPALVANDLWVSQITHEDSEQKVEGVCVETIVCHASGEKMSFGRLFVPASKKDAQGYGSALSYARRYSLMAAFGVCPEDDDGNAASAPRQAPRQQQEQKPKLDAPPITQAQRDELLEAISDACVNVSDICEYYKVDAIKDMTVDRYEHCLKSMKARIAKKAAKPDSIDY